MSRHKGKHAVQPNNQGNNSISSSYAKWPIIGLLSLSIVASVAGSSNVYAASVKDDSSSSSSSSAVVSSRRFTPQNEVRQPGYGDDATTTVSRSEERGSYSTTVKDDWGGIGTMSIDYQQSPAQEKSADNLRVQVSAGNQVYSSSDGKVESGDAHLRDELESSITKANALLEDAETSSTDLDAQAASVSSSIKAVNDAVCKKQSDAMVEAAAFAGTGSSSASNSASPLNQQQISDSFNSWKSMHGDATIGQQVLQYAMQYNGYPYVWGAVGSSSFDCSGLVMYAYAHFGINLPHFSGLQAQQGVEVPASQIQPGDIIANDTHAALYYGKINGVDYVFNALNPHAGVTFTPLQYAFSSSYHIRRVY